MELFKAYWMGPGQPDLLCDPVGDNSAFCRGVGTGWSLKSLPMQAILQILWFYECFFAQYSQQWLWGTSRYSNSALLWYLLLFLVYLTIIIDYHSLREANLAKFLCTKLCLLRAGRVQWKGRCMQILLQAGGHQPFPIHGWQAVLPQCTEGMKRHTERPGLLSQSLSVAGAYGCLQLWPQNMSNRSGIKFQLLSLFRRRVLLSTLYKQD